jgi:asparagine synthase (glutamine-hydrolysing)
MGLRGLHYYESDKRFAVATGPDVLLSLGWVPRILNTQKVAETLVQRDLNAETTYYSGINRVLPGSFVRLRGGRVSKEVFWDPTNIADIKFKRNEDYVEAFQERLNRAVRARLRARRTPCATISGGLDSSSIAVIAADILAQNGTKLHTFTSVPEAGFCMEDLPGNYFDERPYVTEIASFSHNIIPHFITPRKGPLLEQIGEQIRMGDAPSGSIMNGLWIMDICAQACSSGHNVMLVGEMGNLTISYNGWGLFPELVQRGKWLRLIRELSAMGYRWQKILRQWVLPPFIPGPLYSRYKQWRRGGATTWEWSLIHPRFAATSGLVDRLNRLEFDAKSGYNCKLARVENFTAYSETADWYAKLRARFGLDFRTPAFDRRIVEFCIGIPTDQYLYKGCDRWLIRRAMKGRLPESVLYKKKYGVQASDWFPRLTRERGRIAKEISRLALNADVASIIDLRRLSQILENWPGQQPAEYGLDAALLRNIPQAIGMAYFIEKVAYESSATLA